MPKRRVTAKQQAASRRNLEKARAARVSRSRYTGKSGLPRVEYGVMTQNTQSRLLKELNGDPKLAKAIGSLSPYGTGRYAVTRNKKGEITGALAGDIVSSFKKNRKTGTRSSRDGLSVYAVFKSPNVKSSSTKLFDTEPGISLLTAASRMTPGRRTGKMKIVEVESQAKSFYRITGGKQKNATTFAYPSIAKRNLAGRRIVRVRSK